MSSDLRSCMERAHQSMCKITGVLGMVLAKKRATPEDLAGMSKQLTHAAESMAAAVADVTAAAEQLAHIVATRPARPSPPVKSAPAQGAFDFDDEMPDTIKTQARRR